MYPKQGRLQKIRVPLLLKNPGPLPWSSMAPVVSTNEKHALCTLPKLVFKKMLFLRSFLNKGPQCWKITLVQCKHFNNRRYYTMEDNHRQLTVYIVPCLSIGLPVPVHSLRLVKFELDQSLLDLNALFYDPNTFKISLQNSLTLVALQ